MWLQRNVTRDVTKKVQNKGETARGWGSLKIMKFVTFCDREGWGLKNAIKQLCHVTGLCNGPLNDTIPSELLQPRLQFRTMLRLGRDLFGDFRACVWPMDEKQKTTRPNTSLTFLFTVA